MGLYLVSGKSFENTTAKFTPSPSLIEIDKDIVAEGQITVYTKFTYEEIPAGDSDYGVRKSWIVPDGQESSYLIISRWRYIVTASFSILLLLTLTTTGSISGKTILRLSGQLRR